METNSLEEALNEIKSYSIRNIAFKGMPPIDWEIWRKDIDTYCQRSSLKDEIEIVRYALDLLNDGHSGVINAKTETTTDNQNYEIPLPSGKIVGKTGYILLPGYDWDPETYDTYKNATQNLLENIDQSHIDGWMIDLRTNTGGYYGPMLDGLGALIGTGTHAYFICPHKNIEQPCYVQTDHRLKQAEKPMAILMGNRTNSTGEAMLVALQTLENARTFGESSSGCASSNSGFIFKGRTVSLTMGYVADRNKVLYGEKVHPDVPFSGGATYEQIQSKTYEPAADPLVRHASEWIQRQAYPRPSFSRGGPSPSM